MIKKQEEALGSFPSADLQRPYTLQADEPTTSGANQAPTSPPHEDFPQPQLESGTPRRPYTPYPSIQTVQPQACYPPRPSGYQAPYNPVLETYPPVHHQQQPQYPVVNQQPPTGSTPYDWRSYQAKIGGMRVSGQCFFSLLLTGILSLITSITCLALYATVWGIILLVLGVLFTTLSLIGIYHAVRETKKNRGPSPVQGQFQNQPNRVLERPWIPGVSGTQVVHPPLQGYSRLNNNNTEDVLFNSPGLSGGPIRPTDAPPPYSPTANY